MDERLFVTGVLTEIRVKKVTSEHSHLWNNLPFEERKRLMPYQIQSQMLHVVQCREKAVRAHKRHMKELDDLLTNLERELKRRD